MNMGFPVQDECNKFREMKEQIRVGIVEDDAYIRELIAKYMHGEDRFLLVVEANSVEEFFSLANKDMHIDVLIQDIGLPGLSGLEAIRKVKDLFPRTEVLMFSVYDDADRIFKAFCAGASGYLLKNARLEQIHKAIVDIHDGKAAMSPSIAKKVINYFRPAAPKSSLTAKEVQVVQLLTDGLSYKMIADRMQISLHTVQSHIKNIYKKLHVNSKAEVISKKLKGEL